MREESREIQVIQPKTFYIADDGTEFKTEKECRAYELHTMKEKPRVLTTAIENVKSFYDEYPSTIYHIVSIDDWKILKEYIWGKSIDFGEYVGPGDYIAIENDTGDYWPSYSVHEINSYCSDILADAKYYQKHLRELTQSNI